MHVVGSSISAAAAAAGSHKPQKPASSSADSLVTGASPTGPVDTVTLSAAAQELSAHGNAANSPAHRARALIAERPDLASMPFGKVVSGLIHNTLPDAPASEVTPPETGAVEDPPAAITGDTPPAVPPTEGAAPGTDIIDAGAPPTTTVEEPPAEPTADVVPPADVSTVDGGGAGEPVAPVPGATDTAQLIEDLLDQNTTSNEPA